MFEKVGSGKMSTTNSKNVNYTNSANEDVNNASGSEKSTIDISTPKSSNGELNKVAQEVVEIASSSVKTEENYLYEATNRLVRASAVAQYVMGTHEEKLARGVYDRMDFSHDEYLNRIGMGTYGSQQKALDDYMERSVFQSTQNPVMKDVSFDSSLVNVKANMLTSGDVTSIKETGSFSVGGVEYAAKINSDGSATLNTSKFGSSFMPKENNSLTIDIDPLKGISTIHSSVESSCLTSKEIESINKTGSFTRGNVQYDAVVKDTSTVNISARVQSNSYGYQAMCAQNRVPFSNVNYRMNGTGLNSLGEDKIKNLVNKGEYDLGGMKFSAVPSPFVTKDKDGNNVTNMHIFNANEYKNYSQKAKNEFVSNSGRIDINALQRKSSRDADKAAVIANIQKQGQKYICKQSDWLDKNFKGNNARSCISHIDKEIQKALSKKEAGWKNTVNALRDQKMLLQEYEKHGGWIQNPTKNRKQMGKRIVMGQVFGSDMMRGADVYKATIRTSRTAYRAITGVSSSLSYMGSNFASDIIKGAVSSVGSGNPAANSIVAKLDNAKKKRESRYQNRKERIRAQKEGTYKQWKRNNKNRKFSEYGDKLENRTSIIKDKRDALVKKRDELNAKGSLSAKKEQRLKKKDERLAQRDRRNDRRKEKYGKKVDKRNKKAARASKRRELFNKIKNSKVGKLVGKLGKIFSIPGKLIQMVKLFILKVVLGIIGGYLALLLIVGSAAVVMYIICLFVSDIALPTDLTDRLLNGVNYEQMIVQVTEEDIVKDFQLVCQVDATNHFLAKRHIPNDEVPWYYAPTMGEINKVWPWEEADNITRYANKNDKLYYNNDTALLEGATGALVYANPEIEAGQNGNTYVPQSNRTELSNIEANMVPIIAMGHMRYLDTINFETWPTVLGYTYYMFSISHDVARYDTEAEYNRYQYGDFSDDPGYDYEITIPCPPESLYIEGVLWNPEDHTLERSDEVCKNVYVHDFEKEDYENLVTSVTLDHYSKVSDNPISKSFRQIAKLANKFIGKMTGNAAEIGDTFDKGYTDTNDILSLNLRKNSLKGIRNNTLSDATLDYSIERIAAKYAVLLDIKKNISGIFMYDGNEESLPHAQPEAAEERKLNGLGEACSNPLFFPYGITEDDPCSEDDTYEARLIPGADDGAGAIDGCHDHSWQAGCFTLICEKAEGQGHYEDDAGEVSIAENPSSHWVEGHTHTASCYDLTSFECEHGKAYASTGGHKPWEEVTTETYNPGCWKTVSICGGHCGGHVVPLINIVQKVTYEGLAQDDNFKTPYWLQAEEVTNSAGYKYSGIFAFLDTLAEENIVTVGQFRSYWMMKCNSWFSPLPRSPFSFAKTIGKDLIRGFCEAWDSIADGFNKILDNLSGGAMGNYESDFEAPESPQILDTDEWIEKNADKNDLFVWPGWWLTEDTIDNTLISQLYSFTGAYYDEEFRVGKENWSDFDVEFGVYGVGNPIYSAEEIEEIVSIINQYYFDFSGMGLSAKQLAILNAALSRCGSFSYSLTGSGHTNAIFNDSGRGDCSGWVTGTLLKALGVNYNTNAAGFANKGTYNGTKLPGSIIAKKVTGKNYSGHVMIYAGYINGPEGLGHYVMDCSSSAGGSAFRKVSQRYLDGYKYVWNP